MKKKIYELLIPILLIAAILFFLNINATTRQGINYQVKTIKIPLYLKILDFFDRHYNYQQVVKNIINGALSDEERVTRLFDWTYTNIRRNPPGFPVVDDHVWHIIVRGYGAEDQFHDVFTTLCNYAGINAFFSKIYSRDKKEFVIFSFAKISGKWCIFDPYHNVYFRDKDGRLVDIHKLKFSYEWRPEFLETNPGLNYNDYILSLPDLDKEGVGLTRAKIQSPLRRFIFEIIKWFAGNKN